MIRKFDPKKDLVLTRQQSRDFDAWAINKMGIPGAILMENAGRGCAEIIIEELKKSGGRKVSIFCGAGNNGGDGFVIARHLKNQGFDVQIALCTKIEKIKGDAEINCKIARNMKIRIEEIDLKTIEKSVKNFANDSDLIVDAIFGTGLSGAISGEYEKLINAINSLNKTVIAVDIPSGLDCDTGLALGTAIKAAKTVTFAAAKKGFTNPDCAKYTGEIYIASIGIEPN